MDLQSIPSRICPVCGPYTDGAVRLYGFGGSIDGEYCQRCHARWISETFPRLPAPEGDETGRSSS